MRHSPSGVTHALLLCLLAALSGSLQAEPAAVPSPAAADSAEPTAASCDAAIQTARALAETLPPDDLSRRVAESQLVQARIEGGNSEFDDCLEFAARATVEVREHRHRLKAGEALESHPLQ